LRKSDEKSHEITAVPELLTLLEVAGCIVTIDAMGCQMDIAPCDVVTRIPDRGAGSRLRAGGEGQPAEAGC